MANDIVLNRRLLLFSASAFVLAGCGGLGLGPTDADQTIYVLQPALATPPPGGTPAGWALAIDIPDASDSIDTRRIALIKSHRVGQSHRPDVHRPWPPDRGQFHRQPERARQPEQRRRGGAGLEHGSGRGG